MQNLQSDTNTIPSDIIREKAYDRNSGKKQAEYYLLLCHVIARGHSNVNLVHACENLGSHNASQALPVEMFLQHAPTAASDLTIYIIYMLMICTKNKHFNRTLLGCIQVSAVA